MIGADGDESPILLPCSGCGQNTASTAGDECRRCSTYAAADGARERVDHDDARQRDARRQARRLDRRRVIGWNAELRRLREITALRRRSGRR